MNASEMFRACGEPRRIEHYAADHALRDEQARADQRAFIVEPLAATAS